MQYAKIINGSCCTNLPETATLSDGSTVSGFNLLPPEVLLSEGWKEYINKPPEVKNGEMYQFVKYDETDTQIIAFYEVVKIEVPDQSEYVPTQEERIQLLESALNDLLMGV